MLWLGDPNLSLEGPEGDFTKVKEVSDKTGFPLQTIEWKDLSNYGFENVPSNYVGTCKPQRFFDLITSFVI